MNPSTDTSDAGAANLAFARALIDELNAAGVATAVICPGSRSTPLALAVAHILDRLPDWMAARRSRRWR